MRYRLSFAGAAALAVAVWLAPRVGFGDGGTRTGAEDPTWTLEGEIESVDWGAPDVEAFELSFVPVPKWSTITPAPKAPAFTGAIPLPTASGGGFKFEVTPRGPWVDTDGDGKIDTPVKGLVTFKTVVDGEPSLYAAFVKRDPNGGYAYTRACVMAGTVKGEKVALIDENNDGRFDAYGADAMLVGKAGAASHLSRVVNLSGKLYHLKVDALGRKALVREYEGKHGTLNLEKEFAATGRLFSALVAQGEVSFNLAGLKKGLLVPAGEYRLAQGIVGSSPYVTADIDGSGMRGLDVKDGDESVVEWGAPGKIDFSYARNGRNVKVNLPLRWQGRAGETYGAWKPQGMIVNVKVRDAKGRESDLAMPQDDALC